MDDQTITFFFIVAVFLLLLVILYQRFAFHRGIQAELKLISQKLKEIAETGSDEKIMVFTENKILMELNGEINRLLLKQQKIKAEFKQEEMASKKMLANISHDIKTPLTVILGYLENIRLEHNDDKMLEKVELKAKEVMNLINQFFTLAKLEAGDANIEISKININEICKESILDFYGILHQKDFTVEASIPENAIFVQGERDALKRILYNLLSNVIRYGSQGKYLGVSLHQDKNNVYIDVTDRGKGIPPEFSSNVFDRLYTMEDSRNREIQGNGLGLTIAKNLAGQLGGDIFLESKPYVKTVFTVKLKKYLI